MLVLIDDEGLFRRYVEQTLEGTEFTAQVIDDDVSPAEAARSVDRAIVLLGRPLAEKGNPFSRLRFTRQQFVIAVVDENNAGQLEAALAGGADDAILKPIESNALLARLRVAKHRLSGPGRLLAAASETLEHALSNRSTGEIVVRSDNYAGSIHVDAGEVSWASIAGERIRLSAMLARVDVSIDEETMGGIIEESKRTGVHFTRVLVDWGVVDEATARECVRAHIADSMARLLDEENAVALFVPYPRAQASTLRFSARQVMPSVATRSDVVPVQAPPPQLKRARSFRMLNVVGDALGTAAKLPGCIGAALYDRSTGTLIANRGDHVIDKQVAWPLIRALRPPERAIIAEGPTLAHIATPLHGNIVLITAFSLEQVTLGLARTSLNAAGLLGAATAEVPVVEEPVRSVKTNPSSSR